MNLRKHVETNKLQARAGASLHVAVMCTCQPVRVLLATSVMIIRNTLSHHTQSPDTDKLLSLLMR